MLTAEELQSLSDEELADSAHKIVAEQQRRRAQRGLCPVRLETVPAFDPRKHGHAYVAVLVPRSNGKIDREFLDGDARQWDTKRKYYFRAWNVTVPAGTVLEARLNDGSWKNDYRDWYRVDPAAEDGSNLVALTQAEAHRQLKEEVLRG